MLLMLKVLCPNQSQAFMTLNLSVCGCLVNFSFYIRFIMLSKEYNHAMTYFLQVFGQRPGGTDLIFIVSVWAANLKGRLIEQSPQRSIGGIRDFVKNQQQ